MIFFLTVLLVLVVGVYFFLQHPKFGSISKGERLERIRKSPHYREDKFQNQRRTPDLAEGVGYFQVMKEFFFNRSKRNVPSTVMPSQKTELLRLPAGEDVLVWFGHSSYFLQVDGKKILVDPVFSGAASPIKFTTRSFNGTDVYSTADLPDIDYLFLSHDHWDHLDYETLIAIKSKVSKVITGLGVAAHLERWGYDLSIIHENDWNEEIQLDKDMRVVVVPARHFSGRAFKRAQSIWSSFVLSTPNYKLYLGGDSGFDTHFETIGAAYGPFDLAILECGQYDLHWRYIHMLPEQVVQAAIDLRTKVLLPVHWAKFALAKHAWDEPIIRVTAEAAARHVNIIHPMIGEKVDLSNPSSGIRWWESVQ